MSITATVMLSWPPRSFAMSASERATAAGAAPVGQRVDQRAELLGARRVVPQSVGAEHEATRALRVQGDGSRRPFGSVRADPVRDRVQERAVRRLLGREQPLGDPLLGERVVDRELAGLIAVEPVGAAVADPTDRDVAAAAHRRDERARRVHALDPRRPFDLYDGVHGSLDRVEDRLAGVLVGIRDRLAEDDPGGLGGVPRRDVAGARGRDPVAHDHGHVPLAGHLEVERVFVAVVDEAPDR